MGNYPLRDFVRRGRGWKPKNPLALLLWVGFCFIVRETAHLFDRIMAHWGRLTR